MNLLKVKPLDMHGPHVQWFDCEPDWNWIYFDYRVTPVSDPPVYRPWRHEEVPVGKIVKEADPSRLVVRMIDAAEYGDIHLGGLSCLLSSEVVLTRYTMLDGSPCGVREG